MSTRHPRTGEPCTPARHHLKRRAAELVRRLVSVTGTPSLVALVGPARVCEPDQKVWGVLVAIGDAAEHSLAEVQLAEFEPSRDEMLEFLKNACNVRVDVLRPGALRRDAIGELHGAFVAELRRHCIVEEIETCLEFARAFARQWPSDTSEYVMRVFELRPERKARAGA